MTLAACTRLDSGETVRAGATGRRGIAIADRTRYPPRGRAEVTSASVLLVDDEALIRMMVADMVEELGHRVAAEAGTLEAAIAAARDSTFDVALLDVNLEGLAVTPVARIVHERGLPFIFASGYGVAGIPEEFRERPVLQKPFATDALKRQLDAILDR